MFIYFDWKYLKRIVMQNNCYGSEHNIPCSFIVFMHKEIFCYFGSFLVNSGHFQLLPLYLKHFYQWGWWWSPTWPPDAFDELMSLQPLVCFMCGVLWWVASSFLPWIQVTPTLLDNDCHTWHVQSEGCRQKCPWHNSRIAWPILLNLVCAQIPIS